MTNNQEKSSLRKIPNVGSQTEQDLIAMGYTSIESLKGKKAEDLYEEECRLRGCTIDRCQLYLYRALEYFVHTENPDREKCKWWYWKDDYFYPSPCGARCVDCASFPKECKGCRKIKARCSGFSIQAIRYVPSGNVVRNKSGKTVEDVRIYLVVVL